MRACYFFSAGIFFVHHRQLHFSCGCCWSSLASVYCAPQLPVENLWSYVREIERKKDGKHTRMHSTFDGKKCEHERERYQKETENTHLRAEQIYFPQKLICIGFPMRVCNVNVSTHKFRNFFFSLYFDCAVCVLRTESKYAIHMAVRIICVRRSYRS